MQTPGISVIVPVHNGAVFYDAALDSIGMQQWPDLEIIVIDDGSTDDLARRIEARAVPVRYLHQQQQGPAAARNRGLREAASNLIAFLDVDDQWTDGHLSRLYQALRDHPEAGFAQGLMRQFVLVPDGRCLMSGEYRMPYLGSCLFRRSVFDVCGMFDQEMKMGEDYDLVLRCWEKDIPMQRVDQVSLLYRRHEGNMTRGKNNEANLGVLLRRMQRIRSGAVDPNDARRFAFDAYIGDTHKFGDSQLDTPETWNLSSAS